MIGCSKKNTEPRKIFFKKKKKEEEEEEKKKKNKKNKKNKTTTKTEKQKTSICVKGYMHNSYAIFRRIQKSAIQIIRTILHVVILFSKD